MYQELLTKYILEGKLSPDTTIQALGLTNLKIINIQSILPKQGVGRSFLKNLKDLGYTIGILYPKEEAMVFWMKMWEEQLIAECPLSLISWENFICGVESQMFYSYD